MCLFFKLFFVWKLVSIQSRREIHEAETSSEMHSKLNLFWSGWTFVMFVMFFFLFLSWNSHLFGTVSAREVHCWILSDTFFCKMFKFFSYRFYSKWILFNDGHQLASSTKLTRYNIWLYIYCDPVIYTCASHQPFINPQQL